MRKSADDVLDPLEPSDTTMAKPEPDNKVNNKEPNRELKLVEEAMQTIKDKVLKKAKSKMNKVLHKQALAMKAKHIKTVLSDERLPRSRRNCKRRLTKHINESSKPWSLTSGAQ